MFDGLNGFRNNADPFHVFLFVADSVLDVAAIQPGLEIHLRLERCHAEFVLQVSHEGTRRVVADRERILCIPTAADL